MVDIHKLPFRFSPDLLKQDLARVGNDEWVAHFNTAYYSGDWSGVSLRSVGGRTTIYPDPAATEEYRDTPLLDRVPYLKETLASLQCRTESARLLKLGPGARVREHRDFKLGYEDGVARLHIPITTGANVAFYLNGERVEMKEGECWYLNFNKPHSVENNGATDRVHLVVDCLVNDWLRDHFPPETIEA